ncbi:cytochrome P460 family protein [Hydrogenivirga sp. 128-5-R1-1]|uniref:cytochrome P460 family protein n=1 Tax=Hydrogenivirga sp. 128-5-R1-1 TaxID=392423 RepID=UPI00015F0CCB|nr:cytochrome P460 family protein [Hydrogenivirga sp. 128-5-R1-1]EDP75865.1 cytochrome c' [Hydrogenivirga sp. 128-5-R1-1]
MGRKFLLLSAVLFSIVSGGQIFKSGDYKGWHHVKSMVIHDPKHPLYNPFGGIHHVYANMKAVSTTKKGEGRRFPEGAVLAFLLYEAEEAGGAFVEGKKKIEAFMVKDSRRYADTGGWGFFAYDGRGKSIVKDMKRDCFNCHAQVKKLDYVFSLYKE